MITWARARQVIIALLLLVAVVLSAIAWTPQGRAIYNTALFVTQIIPDIPEVTAFQPEPERERVQVDTPEGMRDADIYRPPGDGPHAGVVLFLGVAPAGPDDPRLVNLGEALARAGLVTMIYWSPEKLAERLHPPDAENLVAAYQHLQDQPYVDPDRVGFGGFCVGASFALMAAADESIRDNVAFVNAFGPYYDYETILHAYGTRTRQTEAGPEPWDIDPLTERVTRGLFLDALSSGDREHVERALNVGEAPESASAEAMAVYRILAGGTEEQVETASEHLPQEALDLFRAASPSQYVAGVRAPVLLMHDRGDDLVPAWESRLMYDRMQEEGGDVRHAEFSIFDHMDPAGDVPLAELIPEVRKLAAHLYTIMRQAS